MEIALHHIDRYTAFLFSAFHKSEEEINEEQRIIEAAKHDPNKFGVIYERYFDPIFVFIHKRIMDENKTAELTSEVFYKALYKLHQYSCKGLPFSAWLYRIASNIVSEYYRKAKKAQRHVSIESDALIVLVNEIVDEDRFEEQQKILHHLLNTLKEKEIQLLELRFFEDRSFKEVGEILGLSENNAKVKTFRLLKKMQKLISGK